MSVGLSVDIDGAKDLSAQLGISASAVKDFREPLTASTTELLKTFDMNFEGRGELFGGWPDRKPQYKAGERIDTWPLMEKTGELRHDFAFNITGSEASIVNIKMVEGKRSWNLAMLHQYGTSRGLPIRIVMKLDEERRAFVIKTFQAFLVAAVRNVGKTE